jgi:hypothetical protein
MKPSRSAIDMEGNSGGDGEILAVLAPDEGAAGVSRAIIAARE